MGIGAKEHHYSKESIEETCLTEAKAWFTQANDTLFLTEPLILDLGIIRTQRVHFDQIARETYKLPPGAPNNAHQLLQLLQDLTMITKQLQLITEEQHKQGWTKANEATSSSLLGAHFGHYKASITHKLINELHTLLMDTPLWTGFSYWQWKRGINVMLEKITGNCEATKLCIILLFKADFNQLNKFIWKEMMHQAEENSLVTGEQMEAGTERAQSHRATTNT